MIDTKELRKLAQAATPGPWDFWHGMVATDIDNDGGVVIANRPNRSGGKYQVRVDANFQHIAAANPSAILELLARLESAESEVTEQARLNGVGAERELALMAKLEAAEKECDALKAKIEAMEKQEPVAWLHETRRDSDVVTDAVKHVWGKAAVGSMAAYSIPLYTLPGAKGE